MHVGVPQPADGELAGTEGIGHWRFDAESTGRYIFFNSTRAAALQLVNAAKSAGLDFLSWGKANRSWDDGESYDWFIRLGFKGKAKECRRRVEELVELMAPPSEPSYAVFDPSSLTTSMLGQIAAKLPPALSAGLTTGEVRKQLQAFALSPKSRGYLAWRLSELVTRAGHAGNQSADGILKDISQIVTEDKKLVTDLENAYSGFFTSPDVARRALDFEFTKIDLELRWSSGTEALRRSRSSLAFLRRAIMLTYAGKDYSQHLGPMLARIQPPLIPKFVPLPPHVFASIGNLRRTVVLIDRLFSGIDAEPGKPYTTGLRELIGLGSGAFDFVLEPVVDHVNSKLPNANRLPLVLLPPGEQIHPFVARLRRSGRYRDGEVDPRRLDVLTQLWSHLNESGTCTLYEGAFPVNGGDNGYLVLAIAYEGYGEDAVAISPWKGEHATFVVRADCGAQRSWRTVLTRTKEEAKELGARRLVFKGNPDYGIDAYEAMFQKIVALFTCEPEQFESSALYFDQDEGRYEVHHGA